MHSKDAASIFWGFYRLLGYVAYPAIYIWLQLRLKKGKESAARIKERWGYSDIVRPNGTLIWIHAASVGETMSVITLINKLCDKGFNVLLTTGTVTSAALASERLPKNGAFHQFVPVDLPSTTKRFLNVWKPDIALFCESEIWPNLFFETHKKGIKIGIINGRMSNSSFSFWSKWPRLAASLFSCLDFCLTQSEQDYNRYNFLKAPAENGGNIKFDATPLPSKEEEKNKFIAILGERLVVLAASTHEGEEKLFLDGLKDIISAKNNNEQNPLVIIVPRHPHRGSAVINICKEMGYSTMQRSIGEMPDAKTQIYVADTLGELGLFYSIATIAFIGGSFVQVGGHNPIEPAFLHAPILYGSIVHNFLEMYEKLSACGGAKMIEDSSYLKQEVVRLLEDQTLRNSMADAAYEFAMQNKGAIDKTFAKIEEFLTPVISKNHNN